MTPEEIRAELFKTKDEGYLKRNATQMILGTQTGTRVAADMAYDEDSLYIFTRVSDRTQVPNGADCDAITYFLDVLDTSDERPQTGCYRIGIRMDGSLMRPYYGADGKWLYGSTDDLSLRTETSQTGSYYIVETAIPWSDLGLTAAPTGQRLAFALECVDNRQGSAYTETIPDAHTDKPWTWMELRLQPKPDDTGIRGIATSSTPARETVAVPASLTGLPMTIIRERHSNGSIVTRKILNRR